MTIGALVLSLILSYAHVRGGYGGTILATRSAAPSPSAARAGGYGGTIL